MGKIKMDSQTIKYVLLEDAYQPLIPGEASEYISCLCLNASKY